MKSAFTKSDLKYTLRQLSKKPSFVPLSMLVLAGSLGLSIFTFTLTYTAFYKPLPLDNGNSIYRLCAGRFQGDCLDFRAFDFAQLRSEIQLLENIGVYTTHSTDLQVGDVTRRLNATQTEWNMFELSASEAFLGRTLQAYDHQTDAEPVVVLSYLSWQNLFDGDPNIIGRSIPLADRVTRIIGVMPEGYGFPSNSQIWTPLPEQTINPVDSRSPGVAAFGRLKEGASTEAANNEIDALMYRIRQLNPIDPNSSFAQSDLLLENSDSARISTYPMASIEGVLGALLTSFANFLAGLIFLLACINVGTLLLARTNERLRDVSIRVALGAPRKHLLIQTMGESIFITVLGSILALVGIYGLTQNSIQLTTQEIGTRRALGASDKKNQSQLS